LGSLAKRVVGYVIGLVMVLFSLAIIATSGCNDSYDSHEIYDCEHGPYHIFVNVVGIVDFVIIGTMLVFAYWRRIRNWSQRIRNLFRRNRRYRLDSRVNML
jgi:hypothetical protein